MTKGCFYQIHSSKMIRIALFLALVLLNGKPIYSQLSEGVDIVHFSENELIKGLSDKNQTLRKLCAEEIQNRLMKEQNKVEPGNIVEFKTEYWVNKFGKIPVTFQKTEFEKMINIDGADYSPNYKDVKFYQLDHFHIIRTKIRKKKVKIEDLRINPVFFSIPPEEAFTGIWYNYFIHGRVSSSTEYVKGKKEGMEFIYSSEGELYWAKKYNNNELVEFYRVDNGVWISESLQNAECSPE